MRGIQCAVCGLTYSRITENHTKAAHGMTIKEYRERYGPTTKDESLALASTFANGNELFDAALRGMSPEEIADAQANARLRVFSRQKRYASLYAAFGLMEMRMRHFKKSAEIAERVQAKLCDESWRMEMDEGGNPVSTELLLEIGRYAQTDMKNVGEIFLRLLGQVVQDNKAVVTRPGAVDHSAFTGEYDNISIPDIPGHEREKIRVLMERWVYEVEKNQRDKGVIDGEVIPPQICAVEEQEDE